MTTSGVSNNLSDGDAHAIPCPAARHDGYLEPSMLYVRYLINDDMWLLHCWSNPACTYGEIVQLLGIETNVSRRRRRIPVAHLVAAYDHVDPDQPPRLVFHSWRDDAASSEDIDSREARFRGGINGASLMTWVPEAELRPDHTLLVVGSEVEAISLMRAGVYRDGFVPVTWYRAVRRLDHDDGSVNRVDWSRVHGRHTVFWPSQTTEACSEMYHAVAMAIASGAEGLTMIDPRGTALTEGDDASSLTDHDDITSVLGRLRVVPVLRSPGVDSEAEAADDTPNIEVLLAPRVEQATCVSMAIRLLRDHGSRMVLASRQTGLDIYWRSDSGTLERRSDGLGLELLQSRDRYLHELREAYDAGEMSPEEFSSCIAHASRLASPSGLRDVTDCLHTAYEVLKRSRAVPAGLVRVSISDIDADGRFLGAPNGLIDLDTGRLLSTDETHTTLVSRTIPDDYDPQARHPDVESMTAHLGEENRECLLDAMGYALRGGTSDRIYIVGGGTARAALLDAVRTALGSGYAGQVPSSLLLHGGSEQSVYQCNVPPIQIAGQRLLVGSAPARSGQLNRGLLGDISLADAMRSRMSSGMDPDAVEPMATMFLALDPDALANFDTGDRGLLRRLRLLSYPDPPALDPTFGDRARRSKALRQALVALLVRRCAAMTGPPDHIPHPAPSQSQAHLASSDPLATAADNWLADVIDVTGNRGDRLASATLWEAARAAQHSSAGPDLAWGMSRRSLTTRAIEIHGLGRTRSVRIGDAVVTGWMGVRLVTSQNRGLP